ncbi:MAG TPA: hypothetical protein VGH27_28915 [Streptosporangiaceae bacterium]|jgi:hypothetical protein
MFLPSRRYSEYRSYVAYLRHRRRQRALTAVLMFIALILALAYSQDHTSTHHKARTTHKPAATHVHKATSHPSITTAAQDLSWVNFHGIQLPASAQDGPRSTNGGLASGFADTPGGALVAAINIAVRTAALWGPAIYTPTITHQVTGPDTTALLNADTSSYQALQTAAHVPAGQPAGRGYAAEAAYQFVTWTPASAAVDLVTEGPGDNGATALAVTRIQVVWQHGDWHVVAPPGGTWANSAASLSSLTGYTTFSSEG